MKKRKILLPIFLLSTFVLGGCTTQKKASSESQDTTQYGVSIANKEALTSGTFWTKTNRDLELTLTPTENPLKVLGKGLTITSSNESVIKVTGLSLNAVGVGSATVTVDYHGEKDTVDLTTKNGSPKERYGTVHEGDAADPFDNEDAIKVTKDPGYDLTKYYVKGEITSFYHSPGEREDGAVSWFLKPGEGKTEKFEIYKCFKENDGKLTDDDVWVGGVATAVGSFTKYNDQCETSAAVFVSCEGEKPEPRQHLTKTFAEVLTAGKALEDGGSSWDYYTFDAYVTKRDGLNYFLTATKNEAISDYKANTFELYFRNAASDDIANKLLKGAKVTISDMIIKNYHGQVENGRDMEAAQITVVEAGQDWPSNPEPAVTTRTLAEFIAGENVKTVAYSVTAEVKGFKDGGSTPDKYGNMVLTDGANDLVIYGATATESALDWTGETYVFTNPQDFLTNATTKDIAIGDSVTMKLIRADYSGKVQGTGIVTAVTPGGGGGGGVPEAITTMQGIYESGKVGDAIDVKGVFVGTYGNKTNEWYVANGDYAIYLYQVNIPDGLTVGESVRVQGKLGVFNGLIQVAKDGAVVTEIEDVISYNTLNYNGGAFAKAQLSRPVQLTGTVKTGVAIDGTANKSVTVTVNGTDVTIYVKKSYGLDYSALNTALGTTNNTVTLKGYVAIYDSSNPVNYDTSTKYQVVSPSVVA